jgi:hypothetical protein
MLRLSRHSLPRRKALPASLAAIGVLAAISIGLFWLKERHPGQDLRVSFHIPVAAPSNPAITFTFQNLGRQPAGVRGVGLLLIADNPPVISDSDNIDLCDKVDATALKPPDQITAHGTLISDAGQKREEYAPVSQSAGGKPQTPATAIDIAGGQSLAIAATFKTDTQQTQGFNNQVFCPIVWLAQAGHDSTAVCQGFAMATNNGGMSNTIVARQFRILPASPGASCSTAGR